MNHCLKCWKDFWKGTRFSFSVLPTNQCYLQLGRKIYTFLHHPFWLMMLITVRRKLNCLYVFDLKERRNRWKQSFIGWWPGTSNKESYHSGVIAKCIPLWNNWLGLPWWTDTSSTGSITDPFAAISIGAEQEALGWKLKCWGWRNCAHHFLIFYWLAKHWVTER